MTADARTLADTYFRAWKARDFTEFRSILADDVTFSGPLGRAANAEECVQGIQGLSRIVTDIVVRKVFADSREATTWFELHTKVADEPVLVANWCTVTGGKISSIQVTFDPRTLT